MSRRLGITLLAAAMVAPAWLAGCAALGGARTVTLSHADLQARLERQFPRQRRVLEVIDVDIARPVVRLLPDWRAPSLPIHLLTTPERRGAAKVRAFGDQVAAALA